MTERKVIMPDFLPLFNSLFSLFQATLRPLIYHFLPTLLREDPKEKGIYVYSPLLCALLLRLGDLLDFDSQRTPPILHKLINPQGISSEEWKKHFVIENKRKVKNDAVVILTALIKHHGISVENIMELPEVRKRDFSQVVIREFLDRHDLLKKTLTTKP
jgi:hypothetical protein